MSLTHVIAIIHRFRPWNSQPYTTKTRQAVRG